MTFQSHKGMGFFIHLIWIFINYDKYSANEAYGLQTPRSMPRSL